jgi:hypothetical protein
VRLRTRRKGHSIPTKKKTCTCMKEIFFCHFFRYLVSHVLGDSKWLWISMASMYENLCGNCVGRIELTFLWQLIIAQFWKLSSQCAQLPHTFSYIVAILIHNHFESPNIYQISKWLKLICFLEFASLIGLCIIVFNLESFIWLSIKALAV